MVFMVLIWYEPQVLLDEMYC